MGGRTTTSSLSTGAGKLNQFNNSSTEDKIKMLKNEPENDDLWNEMIGSGTTPSYMVGSKGFVTLRDNNERLNTKNKLIVTQYDGSERHSLYKGKDGNYYVVTLSIKTRKQFGSISTDIKTRVKKLDW